MRGQTILAEPVAFRPHIAMGLVLSRKVFCEPPLRSEPQGGNNEAF
jgi:hypothetical protein